jgi:CRP-like cAMP-binding protein/Fe-S-cluster-containing hydrogenase component 2
MTASPKQRKSHVHVQSHDELARPSFKLVRETRRPACLTELGALDLLRELPPEELAHLAECCVLRTFAPGMRLNSEYRPDQFLYILLEGTLRLTLHDKEGHEVLLGVLGRGDCFGEGPLFGDFFRQASVCTETRCYTLQLALNDVQALLPTTPQLRAALYARYRRRMVESTLARVPLLSQFSPVERLLLAELLQPQHHPRGKVIVRSGRRVEALYLIVSGQALVERDTQTIASLNEGDFFGEMGLLSDRRHTANVRALTPVELLALPADDFDILLTHSPELEEQIREVAEERRANNERLRQDDDQVQQVQMIVERGLLRGSHLLVRNPQLCPPNCTICLDACAERHGQPRLRLDGVRLDNQEVVDACRQCRVGAECVEACPEEALVWNGHGVLIINNQCTGCGACIPACPYDAVTRVPTAQQFDGPLGKLWDALKQRWGSPLSIPESVPTYPYRADKCDLCHGYDDLACVRACPTGSLRLVPVEELLPL